MGQESVSEILKKATIKLIKNQQTRENTRNWQNISFWLPDAVKNDPIRMYPDVEVGHDDVVKLTLLLVREEQVRHPNSGGVRQRQVAQLPGLQFR